jgi:hypothetical protein
MLTGSAFRAFLWPMLFLERVQIFEIQPGTGPMLPKVFASG